MAQALRKIGCICLACGHAVRRQPDQLPPELTLGEIGPRLRCARCTTRGWSFAVIDPLTRVSEFAAKVAQQMERPKDTR